MISPLKSFTILITLNPLSLLTKIRVVTLQNQPDFYLIAVSSQLEWHL